MSPPRWRSAIALALALSLGSCECAPRGEVAASRPRVTVRELWRPQASAVGRTAGVRGDFVIDGPGVRALIGGMQRPGRERGRVLALATPGAAPSDDFESLAPVVIDADRTHAIRVDDVEAIVAGDRRAVRVRGRVALAGGELAIERVHTVADVAGVLAIATRAARSRAWIAERVAWGGQAPFVPGVGRVDDPAWHEASWMGTEGPERALAVGARSGAARVRGDVDPEGDAPYLRATELAMPLTGGEVRTVVAATRGPLAEAVRRYGWSRGRPFPEATVAVVPLPPQAAVRVQTSAGPPWLRSRVPPSGRFQVPLPEADGALVVRATAYGHAASELAPIAPGARVRLHIPVSGRLLVTALDDESGRPIPFRVRIEGTGATPTPELGPIWSAAGARDVAASAGAPIELAMPLGEYRAVVTHGPEWTLEQRTFVVTGARRAELEVPLGRAVDPGAWIACDLHLHAAPSPDSHVTLEDRVTSLVAEGVRFAVATDHNHVTDYARAVHALDTELGTIPGVEVTTWDPAFGHFNAFPFPLDPALPQNGAPDYLGLAPGTLFATLRARAPGAVVQVNHPRLEPAIGYFDVVGYDPRTGAATGPYSDDYDTIEVWNGFDLARAANVERNLAEWIALLARRRAVATGSSDSHTVRTEWAGYPRTYVYVEGGIENAPLLPDEDADAEAIDADAGSADPRDAAADDAAIDASLDAGAVDAIDAGGLDAGAVDAGPNDAGPNDAGAVDAGAVDAGAVDAGAVDAAIDAGATDEAVAPPRVRESDWRLVDALREGRAFVTNGPLLDVRVSGRRPGETVVARRRRAQVSIDVFAPAWIDVSTIDVHVGPRIAHTLAIRPRRARRGEPPGLRARMRADVAITAPTFVVVVVRGEATMDDFFGRRGVRPLAFTNPVWVVPEERPRVRGERAP